MNQLELFKSSNNNVPPVTYWRDFLTKEEADTLFSYCSSLKWQHNKIKIMGKWLDLPRLEIMHGDEGNRYLYSGSVELVARPWTSTLLTLKDKVERLTGYSYNIVMGNYYRNGLDYIGWHSDNEASMGIDPAIASISLGAQRKFQIREKGKGSTISDYWLEHGSLLLMQPRCQATHIHQLPKATKITQPRINLTFRPFVKGAPPGATSELN